MTHRIRYRQYRLAALFVALCLDFPTRPARADVSEDYRFTAFPYYTFSDKVTVYAQLGYQLNPDDHTRTYNLLSPGMYYTVNSWLELWGGLNDRFNNISDGPDTFVLRPFVGPKLSIPNKWKLNLYNFTQYEYRATKTFDGGGWSSDNRIRSRSEVDIPLAEPERAWKPRTWYTITSVEPFYDINRGDIFQVRASGGIGYVLNKHIQVEFLYFAQFARENGGPLKYNENIFRLNLKIGLNRTNDARKASAIR